MFEKSSWLDRLPNSGQANLIRLGENLLNGLPEHFQNNRRVLVRLMMAVVSPSERVRKSHDRCECTTPTSCSVCETSQLCHQFIGSVLIGFQNEVLTICKSRGASESCCVDCGVYDSARANRMDEQCNILSNATNGLQAPWDLIGPKPLMFYLKEILPYSTAWGVRLLHCTRTWGSDRRH